MGTRNNVFLFHKKDDEMLEKVKPIYDHAERYGFTIVNDFTKANIILSFGEDGDFLQAVRKTGFREDCLYAGISTSEKLNIYCDFYMGDTAKIVEAMTNEQIEVRRYPTIDVTVDNQFTFQCLNEFSVRSSIIQTIVMEVFIEDLHFETFRGDGIIVATPTGSTAYNKSVNGAIVDPMLPSIQVSELASINNNMYRTLGSPFILSGDRELKIKVVQDGNDYPTMGMDNEALSIQHVEEIKIKLSEKKIKTVKLKDNSFWEKVQRTFL
jgi:NAD+ kinase